MPNFVDTKSFRFPRSSETDGGDVGLDSSPPPSPLPPLDAAHVPYRRAASHILSRLSSAGVPLPTVGIICGSGLSGLSKALDADAPRITIPYPSVPGFPSRCTVAGHAGEMVVGTLNSVPTVCFRGRFHSYEGHDMNVVAMPVRVMRCLGVRLVVVTNAAGGLKDEYEVGDVAVIRDHIALPLLAGKNPLVGPNDDELGPRFPPTSDLYDRGLQDIVADAARRLGFDGRLHLDGTYAFVSGPQYESRSECAMLRLLGADAVGMSTVPEIVAAHHSGMAVLCLSLITNKVVYYDEPEGGGGASHANHEEVLEAVRGRGKDVARLVGEVVRRCGEVYLPRLGKLPPINLETEDRAGGGEGGRSEGKEKRVDGLAPGSYLLVGGAILAAGAALGFNLCRR